jgi:hypothetical protein
MTKWQGDENTLIDRFDVRSHLDYLEEYKPTENDNEEKFVYFINNKNNLFVFYSYITNSV